MVAVRAERRDGARGRCLSALPAFPGDGKDAVKPSSIGRAALRGTLKGCLTIAHRLVRISSTMMKALRIGLFIGTLIGASACAAVPADGPGGGWYGSGDSGRSDRD